MSNVNNKSVNDKSDGEILLDIARELRRLIVAYPTATLVREKALDVQQGAHRSSRVIEVLSKVVGVSDLYAWSLCGKIFEEINPRTVKKAITNDADAKKDVVAASLEQFVGKHEYDCDDESDAVAVGIAYLIGKGMIASPYTEEKEK